MNTERKLVEKAIHFVVRSFFVIRVPLKLPTINWNRARHLIPIFYLFQLYQHSQRHFRWFKKRKLSTLFHPHNFSQYLLYFLIQGFCVALLFCFFNGEVIAQVKRKWRVVYFRPRANSYTATQVSVSTYFVCKVIKFLIEFPRSNLVIHWVSFCST